MSLNNFNRAQFESRAADRLELALAALADLNELHTRASAELAAGTFDTPEFYQGDPDDKANILGLLRPGRRDVRVADRQRPGARAVR